MPCEYDAAQRNLSHILPDANAASVAQHTQALFRHFACYFADLLSLNRQAYAIQQRYVHATHGFEHLQALLTTGQGFMAATAHLGNWELAGRLLSSYGKTVHVLMAPEQEVAIQRLLRQGDHPAGLRFVTTDHPGVFVQLFVALRRGDVVAFQVDRGTGHRSDVQVEFFGAPVSFPNGPFILAGAAQVPVLPSFCLMRPDHKYDIFVGEAIPVVRGREAMALQQMVRVLEHYVAIAPDQWFNFYDVWDHTPTGC
jgi:KDO2-lipid IV(A) lauroyltransferase